MRNCDLCVGCFIFASCIALVGIDLFRHLNESEQNDLCVEAGGVYVRTYDEYKCYSMDFREELKIGE